MLNLDKLKIYKSFRGDIDSFGRSLNKKIKERMNESEFRLIDELVQGMILIKNDLASDVYKKEIEGKIREAFGEDYYDCQETLDEIVNMAIKSAKDSFNK